MLNIDWSVSGECSSSAFVGRAAHLTLAFGIVDDVKEDWGCASLAMSFDNAVNFPHWEFRIEFPVVQLRISL